MDIQTELLFNHLCDLRLIEKNLSQIDRPNIDIRLVLELIASRKDILLERLRTYGQTNKEDLEAE